MPSEETEIFLVTKVKKLQRGHNSIGYWSLETCQWCPSFDCLTNTITNIFVVGSGTEIPSDSQTKVNYKVNYSFCMELHSHH